MLAPGHGSFSSKAATLNCTKAFQMTLRNPTIKRHLLKKIMTSVGTFSNIFWLTFPRVSREWLSNSGKFLHPAAPVPHLGKGNSTYLSWQLSVPQASSPNCQNHYFTSSGSWSNGKTGRRKLLFHQLRWEKNTALWGFPRLLPKQNSCPCCPPAPQEERELRGLGGGRCWGAAEVGLLGDDACHSTW